MLKYPKTILDNTALVIDNRPNKKLGQHFLKNEAICQKIADLVKAEPSDNLIEIGPGPGALTRYLLELKCQNLLLLEKDLRFAKARYAEIKAQKENKEKEENVTQGIGQEQAICPSVICPNVICIDALKFAWANLPKAYTWKIVGNLPYNIASPLLIDLSSSCRAARSCVFMVQKEVGQRLVAKPNSKDYGFLSIWVQNWWQVKLEFSLGPEAFFPKPKVDSAVVTLKALPKEAKEHETKLLFRIAKLCFQQRRKQLATIARNYQWQELALALENLDLTKLRPEQLSLAEFQNLALEIAKISI